MGGCQGKQGAEAPKPGTKAGLWQQFRTAPGVVGAQKGGERGRNEPRGFAAKVKGVIAIMMQWP